MNQPIDVERGRLRRVSLSTLAIAALVGGFVVVAGTAVASFSAPTPAAAARAACDGVIVVVDSTDLGGDIQVECSEGATGTGRDALVNAGFTTTDSSPGFLCAINSLPNPCPETFEGSFWSYWHSTADGEWTSYQVGADSSAPARGELEGWRYNDGTIPPGIAPAEAVATATPQPEATNLPDDAIPGADEQATNADDPLLVQRTDENMFLIATVVGFVALIIALIIMTLLRQRRRSEETGTPKARD